MSKAAPSWRFKKGSAVPSWMVDSEPVGPGSKRPDVVFGADVIVVDSGYYYWILVDGPLPGSAEIVIHDSAGNSFVFPSSKPIVWASRYTMLLPDGDGDGDIERQPVAPVGPVMAQ